MTAWQELPPRILGAPDPPFRDRLLLRLDCLCWLQRLGTAPERAHARQLSHCLPLRVGVLPRGTGAAARGTRTGHGQPAGAETVLASRPDRDRAALRPYSAARQTNQLSLRSTREFS